MTNNELEKLAKGIASEIIRKATEDEELLDIILPPRMMNSTEAAEFAKIPISTLYQKIKEIPHMKIGKRLVFTDRGLIRWMKRRTE